MKDKSAQILLVVFLLLALLNAATAFASSELACHDFYAAACPQVDVEDGQTEAKKIKRRMRGMIQAAQEVGLKQLGHSSLKDAFFKYIKENGLTPISDLPESKVQAFLDKPDDYNIKLDEIFSELQTCEKRKEKINEKWSNRYKVGAGPEREALISEVEAEMNAFLTEYRAIQARAYAADPVRLFDELSSTCDRLKT